VIKKAVRCGRVGLHAQTSIIGTVTRARAKNLATRNHAVEKLGHFAERRQVMVSHRCNPLYIPDAPTRALCEIGNRRSECLFQTSVPTKTSIAFHFEQAVSRRCRAARCFGTRRVATAAPSVRLRRVGSSAIVMCPGTVPSSLPAKSLADGFSAHHPPPHFRRVRVAASFGD
jgi:hypothetical protein